MIPKMNSFPGNIFIFWITVKIKKFCGRKYQKIFGAFFNNGFK